MNPSNYSGCPRPDHDHWQESRTARFDLPVRHPAKWRFLLDQLTSSSIRLHRYRNLSARILEDTIEDMDCRRCE